MAINICRLSSPYYKGVKVDRMAATVELSHGWPVLARTSQCSATIPFQIYSSIGNRVNSVQFRPRNNTIMVFMSVKVVQILLNLQ
jgi:hypothetical protein